MMVPSERMASESRLKYVVALSGLTFSAIDSPAGTTLVLISAVLSSPGRNVIRSV